MMNPEANGLDALYYIPMIVVHCHLPMDFMQNCMSRPSTRIGPENGIFLVTVQRAVNRLAADQRG